MARRMLARLWAKIKEYEAAEPDGRWFVAVVFGGLLLLAFLATLIAYLNDLPFPME